MKKTKSIVCAFVCILLTAACITPLSAKKVTYEKTTDAYKNTVYYDSLTSVELTGDMRKDLVAIALTQLYYHEGDFETDFNGENTSGSKNFVEYNYTYGKLDQEGNGTLTYGYPWCAAFVSFCLRRAEIPTSIAPSHVNCTSWVNKFKQQSENYKFFKPGTYSPIMGDIIFFKNSSTSTRISDHVGIVLSATSEHVFTIEGNTSDGVWIKTYALSDTKIVGYAVPAYTSEITSSDPGKEYAVTAKTSVNMRTSASTSSDILTSLPHGTVVEPTEFNGGWAKITYGGNQGWVSMSYLAPKEVTPIKIEIDNGDGKVRNIFVRSGSTFSIPIPESQNIDTEFKGYYANGSLYGEITDNSVIFSFENSTKLTAVFESTSEATVPDESISTPDESTSIPDESGTDTQSSTNAETYAIKNAVNGCNASIAGNSIFALATISLAAVFARRKKKS